MHTALDQPQVHVRRVQPALAKNASVNAGATKKLKDARILLVDDEPVVLEMLQLHLEDCGYYNLISCADPTQAMELIDSLRPDVVLTDVMMPEVSGLELLMRVRECPEHAHLPVLVLTSSAEPDTKLRALELGATDFLSKPVDPVELALRLRNNLSVKAYQDQIKAARRESDRLLLSILPGEVAVRLKRGETEIADRFESATVLFADLVDFTHFAAGVDPTEVVSRLNTVFRAFDRIVAFRGLEKIKTIGDAYMLAGGLPTVRRNHAIEVVEAALDMRAELRRIVERGGPDFSMRVGVHTGPVIAGVIGTSKVTYDLWGDTVNVASRLQTTGIPDCIHISEATRRAIGTQFVLEGKRRVDLKGKGPMDTYMVRARVS